MKPYPSHIKQPVICDKRTIASADLRCSLFLRNSNNSQKRVTFIMMNPSKADSSGMDNTIEEVIRFTKSSMPIKNRGVISDVGKVCVLNLFPIYESDSSALSRKIENLISPPRPNHFDEIMNLNRKILTMAVYNSNYVVLAWGDPPDQLNQLFYYKYVTFVIKIIKRFCRFNNIFVIETKQLFNSVLTEKGSPRHPGRNKGIKSLVPCYIGKYGEIYT